MPLDVSTVRDSSICWTKVINNNEPTTTLTGLVLPITSSVLNNATFTHPSLTPQLALSKSRMEIKYLGKIYKFGPNSLEIFKLILFVLSSTETKKLISLIQTFNGPLWVPEIKDYVFLDLAFGLVIFGGTWAKLKSSSCCI